MKRELEVWRAQHRAHKAKMHEASLVVDGEGKRLQATLEEVDRQLVEEKEKIRSLKAAIFRNDDTINKLLKGVVM
jgi:hypothetical protein